MVLFFARPDHSKITQHWNWGGKGGPSDLRRASSRWYFFSHSTEPNNMRSCLTKVPLSTFFILFSLPCNQITCLHTEPINTMCWWHPSIHLRFSSSWDRVALFFIILLPSPSLLSPFPVFHAASPFPPSSFLLSSYSFLIVSLSHCLLAPCFLPSSSPLLRFLLAAAVDATASLWTQHPGYCWHAKLTCTWLIYVHISTIV